MKQTREEILRDAEDRMKSACGIPPAGPGEWMIGYVGNWWEGKMGLGKIRAVDPTDDELVVVFTDENGQTPFMIVQHLAPNLWCNLVDRKTFEWDDDQVVIISPFSRVAEMTIQVNPHQRGTH